MKRRPVKITGEVVVPLTRKQLDQLGIPRGAVVRLQIESKKRK